MRSCDCGVIVIFEVVTAVLQMVEPSTVARGLRRAL